MNPRLWIPLATFAVGFLFAWLAKPAESPPPEETSVMRDGRSLRRVTSDRRESSAMRSADSRIAALFDDGQKWQPGPDEDYPRLLAALQRRAGLSGLDSRAETLLKRLVSDWYDSNPDEALSWVLTIGNPKDETELLNVIVRHVARKDWRAAVALAEQHGAAAGRVIEMPHGVSTEMQKNTLSPEEFVWAYRAGWSRGSLSLNPNGFGKNFQFRETLEAFDDGAFPHQVLSGWAMRDLEAAWGWVNESGIENDAKWKSMMLRNWGSVANDVEFAEVASFFMGEPDPAARVDENLRFAYGMLVARPTTGMVRSVLEQAPGDRQDNLNRLLRISSTQSGANHNRFREELVAQMSPEERAIAFESNREIFDRQLTIFGHSQEEVDRGDIEGVLRVLFDHTPQEIDRMLAAEISP